MRFSLFAALVCFCAGTSHAAAWPSECDPQPISPGNIVMQLCDTTVNLGNGAFHALVHYKAYFPPAYNQNDTTHWPVIVYFVSSGYTQVLPLSDQDLCTSAVLTDYQEGVLYRCTTDKKDSYPFIANRFVVLGVPVHFDTTDPHINLVNRDDMNQLAVMFERATHIYKIDPQRIYFTGTCMGLDNAFRMAYQRPNLPAAMLLFSINGQLNDQGRDDYCTWLDSTHACRLGHIPSRIYAGNLDSEIRPERTQMIADSMRACSPDPASIEFILEDGVAHETEAPYYDAQETYDYLLTKRNANVNFQFGPDGPPTTHGFPGGVLPPSGTIAVSQETRSNTTDIAAVYSLNGKLLPTAIAFKRETAGKSGTRLTPGIYRLKGSFGETKYVIGMSTVR